MPRNSDAVNVAAWATSASALKQDVLDRSDVAVTAAAGLPASFGGNDFISLSNFNHFLAESKGMVHDVGKYGILPWDSGQDYVVGAIVSVGSNLYRCKAATGPATTSQNPSTDSSENYWVPYLKSVGLTGNPTAPTQSTNNRSTRIATTAFVANAINAIQGADLSSYAPLASPAFTGNPTAPTQSNSNDSTRLATTAFVKNIVAAPLLIQESSSASNNGYIEFRDQGADPSGPTNSNSLRVFNRAKRLCYREQGNNTRIIIPKKSEVDVKANLASPAFTGNPTAPTQSSGNDSTRIATTAFVSDAISSSRTIAESSSNANDGYLEFRNQGANPSNPSTNSALRIFNNGGTLYALSSGGTRTSLMQTGSGNTQQVDLSGYARLSGATFTGSLNTNSNSRISGHLTIYESSSAPSSPSQNDSVRIYARNSSLFQKGQGQAERRLTTNTDLSSKANLASPTFTGSPKSTTPGDSDNSTRIATTAYVTSKVASAGTSNLRGSIIEESSNSANDGYIQFRDQGSDPDAPSGNSNSDALRLYNRSGSLWTRTEGESGTALVRASDISGGVSGIVTLANSQTLTGNKRFTAAHFDSAYYSSGNGPADDDNSRNFASTAWVRGRISGLSSGGSTNTVNLTGNQTITGTKSFSSAQYSSGNGPANNDDSRKFASTNWVRGRLIGFSSNPVNLTGNQDVGGTKTFSSAKFEDAEYDSNSDVPGGSDDSRKLASTGWVQDRLSGLSSGGLGAPTVMHSNQIFRNSARFMTFANDINSYNLFVIMVSHRILTQHFTQNEYDNALKVTITTFVVQPSLIDPVAANQVNSDGSLKRPIGLPVSRDSRVVEALGMTESTVSSTESNRQLLTIGRRGRNFYFIGSSASKTFDSGSTPSTVYAFDEAASNLNADRNIWIRVMAW